MTGKINRKEWSDAFKEKAKEVYWAFRKNDVEVSSHCLGRFLSRKNADGSPLTIDQITVQHKHTVKYRQADGRDVRFYDGLALVSNETTEEIITIIQRKKVKPEWTRIR